MFLPSSPQPLKPNELAWRSGGVLLNASVNEVAVTFTPRQPALGCGAIFVASLRSFPAGFAPLIAVRKLLLAFVQAFAGNSRYWRPDQKNNRYPCAAARPWASHVSVPF